MNVTLDFRTNEMRRDTGTSIRTGEFESKKWSVGGILSILALPLVWVVVDGRNGEVKIG